MATVDGKPRSREMKSTSLVEKIATQVTSTHVQPTKDMLEKLVEQGQQPANFPDLMRVLWIRARDLEHHIHVAKALRVFVYLLSQFSEYMKNRLLIDLHANRAQVERLIQFQSGQKEDELVRNAAVTLISTMNKLIEAGPRNPDGSPAAMPAPAQQTVPSPSGASVADAKATPTTPTPLPPAVLVNSPFTAGTPPDQPSPSSVASSAPVTPIAGSDPLGEGEGLGVGGHGGPSLPTVPETSTLPPVEVQSEEAEADAEAVEAAEAEAEASRDDGHDSAGQVPSDDGHDNHNKQQQPQQPQQPQQDHDGGDSSNGNGSASGGSGSVSVSQPNDQHQLLPNEAERHGESDDASDANVADAGGTTASVQQQQPLADHNPNDTPSVGAGAFHSDQTPPPSASKKIPAPSPNLSVGAAPPAHSTSDHLAGDSRHPIFTLASRESPTPPGPGSTSVAESSSSPDTGLPTVVPVVSITTPPPHPTSHPQSTPIVHPVPSRGVISQPSSRSASPSLNAGPSSAANTPTAAGSPPGFPISVNTAHGSPSLLRQPTVPASRRNRDKSTASSELGKVEIDKKQAEAKVAHAQESVKNSMEELLSFIHKQEESKWTTIIDSKTKEYNETIDEMEQQHKEDFERQANDYQKMLEDQLNQQQNRFNETLTSQTTAFSQERQSLQDRIAQLEHQLQAQQQTIQTLQDDLSSRTQELADGRQENESLTSTLQQKDTLINETAAQLKQQTRVASELQQQLQEEITEKETSRRQQNDEMQRHKATLEQLTTVQQQLSAAQEQVESLSSKSTEASVERERQIADLNASLAERNRSLDESREQAAVQIKSQGVELVTLNEQLRQLQSQESHTKQILKEKEKLQDDYKQAGEENDHLKQELQRKTKSLHDALEALNVANLRLRGFKVPGDSKTAADTNKINEALHEHSTSRDTTPVKPRAKTPSSNAPSNASSPASPNPNGKPRIVKQDSASNNASPAGGAAPRRPPLRQPSAH